MTDPWELRPLEGLGPFVFGMSSAEALRHAPAYGGVDEDCQSSPDSPEQIFARFAPMVGEDEARALVAQVLAPGADLRYRRTIAFPSSLALIFLDDGLEEVFFAKEGTRLHVAGHRLFGKGVDPLPALRELQARNGEPPLIHDEDCYFRRLHLTAFAIIAVAADGTIGPCMRGTRLARDRTISWRATPRAPDEDFACHRPVDLRP